MPLLTVNAIFIAASIWTFTNSARPVKPYVSSSNKNDGQPVEMSKGKVSADFKQLLFAISPPVMRQRVRLPMQAGKRTRATPSLAEPQKDFGRLAARMAATSKADDKEMVAKTLRKVKQDMNALDDLTMRSPQLSTSELTLLSSFVVLSYASPFVFSDKFVEFIVPSMGALCATVGFSAEFIGKSSVAKGKETAAITLKAAAEAEEILAQAEREKAILPLCVGVSATASAISLIMPALIASLSKQGLAAAAVVSQLTLVAPLVAGLSAALAALSCQQCAIAANNAIGVGTRRFASSERVGRSWLSATEQISEATSFSSQKWKSLVKTLLPTPLIALLVPGSIAFKAVIATAIFAAQAAYYLANAEYVLAACIESIAKKQRAAAVSDTYANQGARAGSILPFTSALSGLSAALTVAVVEYLDVIPGKPLESLACGLFPTLGALLASAASISKAQTEVDSDAAFVAASELADSGVPARFDLKSLARKFVQVLKKSVSRQRILQRLSKVRLKNVQPA